MTTQRCLQCNHDTSMGDIRSGVMSFGSYFIEYDGDKKTIFGGQKFKLKTHEQRNNRILSYACKNCGYISNYLENVINKSPPKSS